MLLNADFEKAFHPSSIAIVGVSDPSKHRVAPVHSGGLTSGFAVLRNLLSQGYEGHVYPVNLTACEILNLKVYPTVTSIPEKVDLVIVAVPAGKVPDVLRDCVRAGTLNVHVLTSGFGETQQEEGIRLQEEIRHIAEDSGMRLIGPNCMGLHVPSAKMSTFSTKPQFSGPLAFVSQSGTLVDMLLQMAMEYHLGFSKLISCGNSLILDITDFVEYLVSDPETKVISMYVEGVSDGKRLLEIVKKNNPVKPFIIWKVGLSESSARAALSHTGMLGGGRQLWDTFFKQTGAVRVESIGELTDMMMTFEYMKPPRGKKVALLTAGGGTTVAAGETCEQGGLKAPALAPATVDKLLSTISLVNQGVANPLDMPDTLFSPELFRQVLTIMSDDPGVDFLLVNWPSTGLKTLEMANNFAESVRWYVKENQGGKPLAVSLEIPTGRIPKAETEPWVDKILQAGVPVYDSLERACRALSGFIDYHQHISKH